MEIERLLYPLHAACIALKRAQPPFTHDKTAIVHDPDRHLVRQAQMDSCLKILREPVRADIPDAGEEGDACRERRVIKGDEAFKTIRSAQDILQIRVAV